MLVTFESTETKKSETVITPHRGWFQIPWREIWDYRELVWVLIHRDYVSTYKQTIFGMAWHLVQPIMQTVVFVVIFSYVARIPTDGIPPFLFYFSGLMFWRYFQDCVARTSYTFTSNGALFNKVYFPRLIVPISQIFSNLFGLLLNLSFFIVAFVIYDLQGTHVSLNWRIIVLPLLVFETAALSLGLGCIISSLTTRWRDLGMMTPLLLQLGMYASCVVFPFSQIPEDKRWMFVWNPLIPIIEGFRYAALGQGTVELREVLLGAVISVVILVIGLALFHRVEKDCIDSV
jgi:lipopolysaccharide transport system permease protein